ncbi:LpqB family beta-propeller domain-containing protein [Nocardioides sp. SR21]|uniref:LpqB family beta-propeller domain-containing protein n=1 Tax=Nocardioides sp. SR21 TaxID=2919501 RepID=UPI001FA9C8FE|nr:LpqB family beta-propeller domain-containing protein [Nocardioides sp. SR21]
MNRTIATALAAACLVLVSGCVRVPTGGPVEETRSEGKVSSDPGVFIDPRPPQDGEGPVEIVDHFLDAMQATPIQTQTARRFLSEDADAAWDPGLETITYAEPPAPIETPDGVLVTLTGADRLDERGAWQGALPADQRDITFPMVMEDGEWRIDAAPDALIVPEDWFESRYVPASLYFFDPTQSILAPEPIYVPKGEQLASSLIKKLVKGPGDQLRRVVQSAVPAGLEVVVGVRVSGEGEAVIPLAGEAQLTAATIELMMAQFAWTLRQDAAIETIRVTLNGDAVPLPGGVSAYRVDGGDEYDPAGFRASPLLYGLRDGRVVSGTPSGLSPVAGPLGSRDLGLRSIGTSLDATAVAGVGAEGTSLLMGELGDSADSNRVETIVSSATDLLRPSWDFAGRTWLVDRTTAGARVLYVYEDRVQGLRIPGLTGTNVRSFQVSRDGTRLVAVVRRDGSDLLVVSRIEHSGTGRVVGATRTERIGTGGEANLPIRSITWASPERLAMLIPLTPTLTHVQLVSVDGSPAVPEAASVSLEERLHSLAGSPYPDEPLYGLARDTLVRVVDQDSTSIDPGITTLVYVG